MRHDEGRRNYKSHKIPRTYKSSDSRGYRLSRSNLELQHGRLDLHSVIDGEEDHRRTSKERQHRGQELEDLQEREAQELGQRQRMTSNTTQHQHAAGKTPGSGFENRSRHNSHAHQSSSSVELVNTATTTTTRPSIPVFSPSLFLDPVGLRRLRQLLLWREVASTSKSKSKLHKAGTESATNSARVYYHNSLTSQTSWTAPDGFEETKALHSLPGTLHYAPFLEPLCAQYGIRVEVLPSGRGQFVDELYGREVQAVAPSAAAILLYAPLLARQLRVYPPAAFSLFRVRRFVLTEDLRYRDQPRKALPVMQSGTLYLDCRGNSPEFLASVFHHELFHMFDDLMLLQMKLGTPRKEKDPWDDAFVPALSSSLSSSLSPSSSLPSSSSPSSSSPSYVDLRNLESKALDTISEFTRKGQVAANERGRLLALEVSQCVQLKIPVPYATTVICGAVAQPSSSVRESAQEGTRGSAQEGTRGSKNEDERGKIKDTRSAVEESLYQHLAPSQPQSRQRIVAAACVSCTRKVIPPTNALGSDHCSGEERDRVSEEDLQSSFFPVGSSKTTTLNCHLCNCALTWSHVPGFLVRTATTGSTKERKDHEGEIHLSVASVPDPLLAFAKKLLRNILRGRLTAWSPSDFFLKVHLPSPDVLVLSPSSSTSSSSLSPPGCVWVDIVGWKDLLDLSLSFPPLGENEELVLHQQDAMRSDLNYSLTLSHRHQEWKEKEKEEMQREDSRDCREEGAKVERHVQEEHRHHKRDSSTFPSYIAPDHPLFSSLLCEHSHSSFSLSPPLSPPLSHSLSSPFDGIPSLFAFLHHFLFTLGFPVTKLTKLSKAKGRKKESGVENRARYQKRKRNLDEKQRRRRENESASESESKSESESASASARENENPALFGIDNVSRHHGDMNTKLYYELHKSLEKVARRRSPIMGSIDVSATVTTPASPVKASSPLPQALKMGLLETPLMSSLAKASYFFPNIWAGMALPFHRRTFPLPPLWSYELAMGLVTDAIHELSTLPFLPQPQPEITKSRTESLENASVLNTPLLHLRFMEPNHAASLARTLDLLKALPINGSVKILKHYANTLLKSPKSSFAPYSNTSTAVEGTDRPTWSDRSKKTDITSPTETLLYQEFMLRFPFPALFPFSPFTAALSFDAELKRNPKTAKAHKTELKSLLHSRIAPSDGGVNCEAVGCDPLWLLLNPPGFHYGSGGQNMRDPSSAIPFSRRGDTVKDNPTGRSRANSATSLASLESSAKTLSTSIASTPSPFITLSCLCAFASSQTVQREEVRTEKASGDYVELPRLLAGTSFTDGTFAAACDGSGSLGVLGFFNQYATSAIEEDKAETYAALIRFPSVVLRNRDPFLRAKALELLRRLRMFHSDFNQHFLERLFREQARAVTFLGEPQEDLLNATLLPPHYQRQRGQHKQRERQREGSEGREGSDMEEVAGNENETSRRENHTVEQNDPENDPENDPSCWILCQTKEGSRYWLNTVLNRASWTPPPALSSMVAPEYSQSKSKTETEYDSAANSISDTESSRLSHSLRHGNNCDGDRGDRQGEGYIPTRVSRLSAISSTSGNVNVDTPSKEVCISRSNIREQTSGSMDPRGSRVTHQEKERNYHANDDFNDQADVVIDIV